MKTIYLLRHAKSSWSNPLSQDFDRPLNEQGISDAPLVANAIKKKKILPDLIISSPANRAISTALIFAEILGYPKNNIELEDNLYYDASAMDIIEIIKKVDSKYASVLLAGHNPGMTEAVNFLTSKRVDSLSTCSFVSIHLEANYFAETGKKNCSLISIDSPSKFK